MLTLFGMDKLFLLVFSFEVTELGVAFWFFFLLSFKKTASGGQFCDLRTDLVVLEVLDEIKLNLNFKWYTKKQRFNNLQLIGGIILSFSDSLYLFYSFHARTPKKF